MAKVVFKVELELSGDPSYETLSDINSALSRTLREMDDLHFADATGEFIDLLDHTITIA